ncbi:MAG: hypothetical protein ACT4NY_05335 [Pseudonocardiales bacterium]
MSTNATQRWRAALLAVLAALSLALVGCTDTAPTDGPGTEQDDGNDDQDDGSDDQDDGNDDQNDGSDDQNDGSDDRDDGDGY